MDIRAAEISAILKQQIANFGTEAKLGVTPAYIVGGVVILGHPGLKPLQAVVKSMRACGKVVC